jgi:hypothetical protein
MTDAQVLAVRGFQLHITHYDPRWARRKAEEEPFDLELGLEAVDAMAEAGLNLLVVDCADGVRYDSHPELERHYSVPMDHLRRLVARAGERGIEVVPKLNYARSAHHQHNHWFRPHNKLFDTDESWELAFELIDELIEVCAPPRFFHIGMDEDHDRSHAQYAEAIRTLRDGLAERDLRAVMWKDEQTYAAAQVHAEKARAAEDHIPTDVVQVVWHYHTVLEDVVERLKGKGFDVWGAPGQDPDQVRAWRDALIRRDAQGFLLTQWIPCVPANREKILGLIRTNGPLCSCG